MMQQSTFMSRVHAVALAAAIALYSCVALAQTPATAIAAAQAEAPAEDALKQIIDEGNPAYLDWSTALADRARIGKFYQDSGYRLFWSDGEKPTAAAIV